MADSPRPIYSNERTDWEELGVALQMQEMDYIDSFERVKSRMAPIDWIGKKAGRRVLFEVKVRDVRSTTWPTIRVSKSKYDFARIMLMKGETCRYIVQWLDRCISYRFTTWDLPVHEGKRHDRPGVISPCVDMPKQPSRELWVGSIVLRHVEMLAPR